MQKNAKPSKKANAPLIRVEQSTPTIKTYFEKILQLKKSGEQFPVNLDDVFPLVYSAKNKAVRALSKDFIEGEDFLLAQTAW